MRHQAARPRATAELWLPNANDSDSARSSRVGRAPPATWSWSHSGSGSVQLIVGQSVWCHSISAVAATFTVLAAPKRCPKIGFSAPRAGRGRGQAVRLVQQAHGAALGQVAEPGRSAVAADVPDLGAVPADRAEQTSD